MNFYRNKQANESGVYAVYAYDTEQVEKAVEFRRICSAIESCSGDERVPLELKRDELRAYESVAETIENSVLMTEAEVFEHRNPTKTDEQVATEVRTKRDLLLRELDAFASNPLRWSELSNDQKTEASGYRTLLLDVPQQKGFPHSIEWPVAPDFMD